MIKLKDRWLKRHPNVNNTASTTLSLDACDDVTTFHAVPTITDSHEHCMVIEDSVSQRVSGQEMAEQMECAKTIEEGPARTPLFTEKLPTKLSNSRTLTLDESAWRIWPTPLPDTVIIGGYKTPTLWVVDHTDKITPHVLKHGRSVHSGVCINTEKSILHVTKPDAVLTCVLDITLDTSTEIVPVSRFKVENPIHTFRLGKNKYGILCAKPSSIRKFILCDILMETAISPTEIISIDAPHLREYDKACVTPDAYICVTSYHEHCVYVLSEQGDKLHTLGTARSYRALAAPGMLLWPRSIQCGNDGRLLVGCQFGDVHLFDGEHTTLLKDDKGSAYLFDSVATENKMWIVWEKKVTIKCIADF